MSDQKQGDRNKSPTGSVHHKVCVHLFHGQDEGQIGILWPFLLQYGLRIMHEGKYKEGMFRFFRS